MNVSSLQKLRYLYQPTLPTVFHDHGMALRALDGEPTSPTGDHEAIRRILPLTTGLPLVTFEKGTPRGRHPVRVGVVLSGGQAPGGHNVIAGLYDALITQDAQCKLYGFHGGPDGLLEGRFTTVTAELIDPYRNTGGFDIIGSGRTKLATEKQFAESVSTCKALGIDALVIVGGDDSNTNACLLAEYCLRNQTGLQVIGCPKTIDGDLKNEWIEASFGFDTATKVYGELIGNILRDANSARKYWHFIKLMGRSASHIALECALSTHPNVTIISEEVRARQMTLNDIVEGIASAIVQRSEAGKNFGVCLVPEGLIEFIPEVGALISELNALAAKAGSAARKGAACKDVSGQLSAGAARLFLDLPPDIQQQLLMDRDDHGNVQVSRIDTEKLLIELVTRRMAELKAAGRYAGKFSTQAHFFGYEGRCAAPSNFDANYCYALGTTAAALIAAGKTGYLASVRNLANPPEQWEPGGVPLAMLMNMERRHAADYPVIRKALVDLDGAPFQVLSDHRDAWLMTDDYRYPGPIQYFGPPEVSDSINETLRLEASVRGYSGELRQGL